MKFGPSAMPKKRMFPKKRKATLDMAMSGLGLRWMRNRNLFPHSWSEIVMLQPRRCLLTILLLALPIESNLRPMGTRFILKRSRGLLGVKLITRCSLRCMNQAKRKRAIALQSVTDAKEHRSLATLIFSIFQPALLRDRI